MALQFESELKAEKVSQDSSASENSKFEDREIKCIDCRQLFIWSAGEQQFFHDKNLKNPPKRCKTCKKAKNERIAAILAAQEKGVKQHIEVAIYCARCNIRTTVPFYPSQGRPVFCRSCFLEMNPHLVSVDYQR